MFVISSADNLLVWQKASVMEQVAVLIMISVLASLGVLNKKVSNTFCNQFSIFKVPANYSTVDLF